MCINLYRDACTPTHTPPHKNLCAHSHQKRKKWFSPGVDRVSSFQPREFISCLKHYHRGSFPMLQSAAFHTHSLSLSHTYTHTPNLHFPSFCIYQANRSLSLLHQHAHCPFLSLCLSACVTPHTEPHTPAGVVFRRSLLTFPGRLLKPSRLSCLCKRCLRGAAEMAVKRDGGLNKHMCMTGMQPNTCASLHINRVIHKTLGTTAAFFICANLCTHIFKHTHTPLPYILQKDLLLSH